VPVACIFETVPNEPSVGQFFLAEVVVVVPLVAVVVVVYWHGTPVGRPGCQFTFVFVAPVTVAVSVVDWPTIRVFPTDEVMLTLITLAVLLLPQPLNQTRHIAAAANHRPRRLVTLRNLIPTISPTQLRSAEFPLALELSTLRTKSIVPVDLGFTPHRRT
jgi:hypothetical protein